RIEAMNQLSDFKKHDPAPVFVELAQSDTSEEIQSASLDYLRQSVSDDNKSVLIFRGLFEKVPSSRADQRSMILYEIADIGNDGAVDFLSNVARHDSSYDLRSEAVYYLGNIGGEKARTVLYDMILNK
ncbi:MAG: HEAT repeat domain-containing protein, partial [Bacteroidota bacterium]